MLCSSELLTGGRIINNLSTAATISQSIDWLLDRKPILYLNFFLKARMQLLVGSKQSDVRIKSFSDAVRNPKWISS